MSIGRVSRLQVALWLWLLILVGSPMAGLGEMQASPSSQDGQRQRPAGQVANRTISALLVSDIHFDPFHDPVRARQLVDAPVSEWSSILSAPSSPNQQQAFADLQQGCHARGVDTPYTLLRSSLQAMESQQPDAKFMTVSGDLIAHAFHCRYVTLFPGSTQSDYQSFVLKTLSFVTDALRAAFPGVPVYVALGNNDTPCDDYRLDTGSDFLVQAGRIAAKGLPPSQQQQALQVFARGGYYSVTMPAPMRDTRLIVLNDLFLSSKYRGCAGAPDPAAATAQMTWLQQELAQAQRLGQSVWVMGHISPGVDPFATFRTFKAACGNQAPEMFLDSDELADMLMKYGDVIRLGLFAHSHMDEIRLLQSQSSDPHASSEHSVALKLVPSISPVDGNNPSFTVARVNPSSAVLENYEVIAASNQTGIDTTWATEYDYAQTYHEAEFSPSTVKELIGEFENDRGAKTQASKQYIHNYYVSDSVLELQPFWPQYICAMANYTAKSFAACTCSAGK
jgi:sphingomyelin phosphodiesterase acid-like 3